MKRSPFIQKATASRTISGISNAFAKLSQIQGQVTHALLTRAPLYSSNRSRNFSFDLHVLGTPPAFILSQDQTLQLNSVGSKAQLFSEKRTYSGSSLFSFQRANKKDSKASNIQCQHISLLKGNRKLSCFVFYVKHFFLLFLKKITFFI